MDFYTIFLYLIRVERIQESKELQSTTHLGKEVQDSKGANTCPFIFVIKNKCMTLKVSLWKLQDNAFIKKTSISRGLFMVLLNQVFPCFHCFNKTSPTHKPILQELFFEAILGVRWFNWHIWLILKKFKSLKKHLNSFALVNLIIRNSVWGVFWSY